MSMGQQLGSGAKSIATAGMTPSAGNMMLPGQMPGKTAMNQLQQSMMPQGAMGPVAPQPMQPQFENRASNQSAAALKGAQSYTSKPMAQNVNSLGLRSIGAFNGPAVPGGMRF